MMNQTLEMLERITELVKTIDMTGEDKKSLYELICEAAKTVKPSIPLVWIDKYKKCLYAEWWKYERPFSKEAMADKAFQEAIRERGYIAKMELKWLEEQGTSLSDEKD